MSEAVPEPWLRGTLNDVDPLVQPVFFSFAQVREDLAKHLAGMPADQVWRRMGGASAGFHLKAFGGQRGPVDNVSAGLRADSRAIGIADA